MSFQVTETHNNGYRCGCCHWSDDRAPKWYESREEALEQVPRTMPGETEWGGLESIEVIDGSTGETIAEGRLSWPIGYGKSANYQATRWYGWIDPGDDQPLIHFEDFKGPGETWEDSINILKEKHRALKEREAQRKLEEAQRELTQYRKD